jgi:hypothetical protein
MKEITNSLPRAVADCLAACNAHDPDGFMAVFVPDALVNDNRREFLGQAAIRAWADKELFGDNVTCAVERAYDQHGDVIVHSRTNGDYDKTNLPDPLILSWYFSLRDGRITQLIITLNTAFA